MSTATVTLMTAAEFALLPQPEDGTQQELVNGVIETMPPPGFYHGVVCLKVGRVLGNYVDAAGLGYVTSNDSGVVVSRDPDTVRGPDVAFYSKENMPELLREGYATKAPDLVAEVLSPGDVFMKMTRKIRQYLSAKVRVVWILVPEDRSVLVCRAGQEQQLLSNGDTLTCDDVLPGFGCPVSSLFP